MINYEEGIIKDMQQGAIRVKSIRALYFQHLDKLIALYKKSIEENKGQKDKLIQKIKELELEKEEIKELAKEYKRTHPKDLLAS